MIKIAILGTSKIAELMCDAIDKTDGIESVFVCSRSCEKGRNFAYRMGIEGSGSFQEMLDDRSIDAVYIASPNSLHVEQAVQVLNSGKNVLLEKPASLTTDGIEELDRAARTNGVFWMEAITTIFMPDFLAIEERLEDIGEMKEARISFGRRSSKFDDYLRGEIPSNMSRTLGGGALNDMGIYCIHTAVKLFGKPKSLRYEADFDKDGVDLRGELILEYPGFVCNLKTSKNVDIDCGIELVGEKGYLKSLGEVNIVPDAKLYLNGKMTDISVCQAENRMEYEVRAFCDGIMKKDTDFFGRMTEQSRMAAWVLEKVQK